MWVDLEDIAIAFDVEGRAEWRDAEGWHALPTIVAIHGGPGANRRFCKPLGSALTEIAQLLYIDLRGHGGSSLSHSEQWTLANWADDVVALCVTLGIERPLFMGVSFGGLVAQTIAARHPASVGGLILIASARRFVLNEIADRFESLGGAPARQAVERVFSGADDLSTLQAFAEHCLPHYSIVYPSYAASNIADGDWRQQIFSHFTRLPGGEFHAQKAVASLATFAGPVLVLSGSHDPLAPPSEGRALADAMPSADLTFAVIANASHAVYLDQPELVSEAIRAFVNAHG